MNDIIRARVEGTVLIDGVNIYDPGLDIVRLRRVRMVFRNRTVSQIDLQNVPTGCASTTSQVEERAV